MAFVVKLNKRTMLKILAHYNLTHKDLEAHLHSLQLAMYEWEFPLVLHDT